MKTRLLPLPITLTLLNTALILSSCGQPPQNSSPSLLTDSNSSSLVDKNATQREEVRAANRKLVNACATTITTEDPIEVNYWSQEICKRPNTYRGNHARYRINRNTDQSIGLNIKLAATIMPLNTSPTRAQKMLNQVSSCIPEIQQVFKRYNIQLTLDLSHKELQIGSYDQNINLIDTTGRSSSLNWYLRGYLLEWDIFLCPTILHELGHLLSLNDEYEDVDCPDRPFISTESNPSSIMASTLEDSESVDFYPRHIAAILQGNPAKPICPSVIP